VKEHRNTGGFTIRTTCRAGPRAYICGNYN
jgi:hypothetical protein